MRGLEGKSIQANETLHGTDAGEDLERIANLNRVAHHVKEMLKLINVVEKNPASIEEIKRMLEISNRYMKKLTDVHTLRDSEMTTPKTSMNICHRLVSVAKAVGRSGGSLKKIFRKKRKVAE